MSKKNHNEGMQPKKSVAWRPKASIWRIFNGLFLWLSMAAGIGMIIALANFYTGKSVKINNFDFYRYLDVKLWVGLLIGSLIVRLIYSFIGPRSGVDVSIFTDRAKEDVLSNLVSFGWLFILSSIMLVVVHRYGEAILNFFLGVFNLVVVYFLAAKQDEEELSRRASNKPDANHSAQVKSSKPKKAP